MSLAGPVLWFAVFLVALAVVLAIFVIVESLRPRWAPAQERLREPLWTYTLGQGLFLVLLVFLQLAPLPPVVSGFIALMVPLAIAQALAFMLRVMWPKPENRTPAEVEAAEQRTSALEAQRARARERDGGASGGGDAARGDAARGDAGHDPFDSAD